MRATRKKVFMFCDELDKWYVMMVENCLARQEQASGKMEAKARVRELRKQGYYWV